MPPSKLAHVVFQTNRIPQMPSSVTRRGPRRLSTSRSSTRSRACRTASAPCRAAPSATCKPAHRVAERPERASGRRRRPSERTRRTRSIQRSLLVHGRRRSRRERRLHDRERQLRFSGGSHPVAEVRRDRRQRGDTRVRARPSPERRRIERTRRIFSDTRLLQVHRPHPGSLEVGHPRTRGARATPDHRAGGVMGRRADARLRAQSFSSRSRFFQRIASFSSCERLFMPRIHATGQSRAMS